MKIELSGTILESEYHAMLAFERRRYLRVVLLVSLFIALVVGVLYWIDVISEGVITITSVVLSVALVIQLYGHIPRYPDGYKKPFSGFVDEDGIDAINPPLCPKGKFRWERFTRYWLFHKDVVVLDMPSGQIAFMTRGMFSNDGDWGLFLELMKRKLPGKDVTGVT